MISTHLKNVLVKLDHFPKNRGENVQKYLKPPPGSKKLFLLLCLDLWTGGSALSPVHFEVNGGQLPSRSSNIPWHSGTAATGNGLSTGGWRVEAGTFLGEVFPGQNQEWLGLGLFLGGFYEGFPMIQWNDSFRKNCRYLGNAPKKPSPPMCHWKSMKIPTRKTNLTVTLRWSNTCIRACWWFTWPWYIYIYNLLNHGISTYQLPQTGEVFNRISGVSHQLGRVVWHKNYHLQGIPSSRLPQPRDKPHHITPWPSAIEGFSRLPKVAVCLWGASGGWRWCHLFLGMKKHHKKTHG